METETDHTLDARGLNCPMPVVKTKQEIDEVDVGGVLEVLATDPGAESDIEAWCSQTGNEFLGMEEPEDEVLALYVRKTE